jgi:hypothetical protein
MERVPVSMLAPESSAAVDYEPMVLVSYKLLDDYRTLYTINTSFWACSRQTTLPRWDA